MFAYGLKALLASQPSHKLLSINILEETLVIDSPSQSIQPSSRRLQV